MEGFARLGSNMLRLLRLMALATCASGFATVPLCDPDWYDKAHFDCQMYEQAGWCKSDGTLGEGWCKTSYYLDGLTSLETCHHIKGDTWGWYGSLDGFTTKKGGSAADACAGCGSECPPTTYKRTPNALPADCVDAIAPSGGVWRDSYGYTCASYQYGNFCVQTASGGWEQGGLWKENGYGELSDYAW
eukprot:CAMPEP_0119310530 /NCGR_PEP_ID=MMETSP1333-20130426/19621_1 /TAXON_ID=418940 /ORGANISM="Scyphosphaera apsteinii, Strain RCC1455" /LENGTH=187 /DNA_ID=CAMNT_0007314727 /DNA_START=37 /DNA_END=597 /DNA_ORIENTATION=-